jgi:hypothetical protein
VLLKVTHIARCSFRCNTTRIDEIETQIK